MIAKNKVADSKTIPSLREIEESDITQVGDLLRAYLARFDISPVMTEEDMRQNFYSGKGVGPVNTLTGRREGQVTWTYVVEVRSIRYTIGPKVILATFTMLTGSRIASYHGLFLVLYPAIYGNPHDSTTDNQCSLSLLLRNLQLLIVRSSFV